MSKSTLWLAIEPRIPYCQMHLSLSGVGTLMKARLAPDPIHGGMAPLLEALSAWHGAPLCAVLDADAEEVTRHPERWTRLLGEAEQSPRISVEWSSALQGQLFHHRFFEGLGDFRSSRRLMTHAATGLK